MYRAIILSTLLYGVETWSNMKKLHAFMMRHLQSILKIKWWNKVTNIKVLKRAGGRPPHQIRTNLRWTRHHLRMPTDRLPRQVLYLQQPEEQRPCGRPRLRYKDTTKRNLKKRDIDTNSCKSLTTARCMERHSKVVLEMKVVFVACD